MLSAQARKRRLARSIGEIIGCAYSSLVELQVFPVQAQTVSPGLRR